MGLFKKKTEQKIEISAEQKKPEESKKKKANRKRTVAMTIRMTPEEAAAFNEKHEKSGMNKTDFIISAVNEMPLIVIEDAPKILKELRMQGTNLNQAVRMAHQKQTTDFPELKEALENCREAQKEFVKFIEDWNMKISKGD